ncbi:extracellular solute-binding protein [Vibrio wakamikoensis]|uniref:Extracellular solute-binding protein n=1 Tax=Vibrio chaetopteri TaxID=3016528 RepID=A0AAU8BLT4_9VIBR
MKTLLVALLLCISITISPNVYSKNTLKVLSWHGYTDQNVVTAFKTKHRIDVEITYINNDRELRNHIEDSNKQYDVVALNSAELRRYIKLLKVDPINTSKISNLKWLSDQFTPLSSNPETSYSSDVYGIPYTFSSMGLIYSKDRVDQPPRTWRALWSQIYQNKVLGYDGGTHNVSLAAIALGLPDPFQIPSQHDKQIAEQLITLRENALTFYDSVNEATELFNKFELSLMFANYGHQQLNALRKSGANVGYIIPDEGALAWVDCWAILADSAHTDLAHLWIDFLLEPWVQRSLIDRHGLQSSLGQFSQQTSQEKLIWLSPVESGSKREAMWNAVYSGKSLSTVLKHIERFTP